MYKSTKELLSDCGQCGICKNYNHNVGLGMCKEGCVINAYCNDYKNKCYAFDLDIKLLELVYKKINKMEKIIKLIWED